MPNEKDVGNTQGRRPILRKCATSKTRVGHGGATFGPNQGKWPGGLRSGADDAVPVPPAQGIGRCGCAAETPVAVTFAAGAVADRLSSLVNQRPAHPDQQGMTASVVPIARAVQGDGRHAFTRCDQRQAVRRRRFWRAGRPPVCSNPVNR